VDGAHDYGNAGTLPTRIPARWCGADKCAFVDLILALIAKLPSQHWTNTYYPPPRGVEPLLESPGKRSTADGQRAETGAIDNETTPIDPDLQLIVESWGKLPVAIKAGILAIVRAS